MVFANPRFTHIRSTLALFILIVGSAEAQTVLYEDGYASGIKNLRIDNRCFDVDFAEGSYFNVFGRSAPTFLDQPDSANSAANAIRDTLNAERGVPEINASDAEVLWIPNDSVDVNRFRAEQVGHDQSTDPWRRYADFEGVKNKDWDAWDFAVFDAGPDVVYAANTGHAVGINNLNIDGTCLDVRFADGSYNEVYADHAPRYLGFESRANNAANMMMNLLNAEAAVPEINDSNNEVLWIPTDRTRGQFEAEQLGHNDSSAPWQRYGDFAGTVSTNWAAWDFAVFDETLDCNRDGVVDINDMNCACGTGLGDDILGAIDSVAGDLDGNGHVSFGDFLTLSANFGEAGQYTDGDLDCDGVVGFSDFLLQSSNFGGGPPIIKLPLERISAVPEPNGIGLAAACVPMVMLARRRRS